MPPFKYSSRVVLIYSTPNDKNSFILCKVEILLYFKTLKEKDEYDLQYR